MNIYKPYQQNLKQSFSKIPIIFQDNNFLPTENIYMELAISDYSPTYQTKIDELSKDNFENLPLVIQERQIEKEIRKLSIQKLFRGSAKKASVVLGDPGSGKSTLLKTIAYRSAHEDKYYPRYVFFLELKKFKDIYLKNKKLKNAKNIILEYLQKIELDTKENIFEQIEQDQLYFLFDGWDEVVGDKKIADQLSNAIKRCSDIGNVILTSRRAADLSYFSGFDFYEILDLSTRAIKNYILNFSKAMNIDDIKARTLVNNILNNEVLLRMARNPFLLSLICFLKSKEVLSDSTQYRIDTKIQLYDAVIKEMQKEFNKKQFGMEFDRDSIDILSHFSFELFNYRDKTKHIFSNDDFKEFAQKENYDKELLNDVFLRSKFLDSFSGNSEIYFIHLTFQEYLTAWQLSKLSYELSCRVVENVLEKPSWKQVLRFYAGILHSHLKPKDSEKKFQYLLKYAWKQRDELGLIEVEMGYWFADAGILVPEDKPYDKLREVLWEKFDKGMACASDIIAPLLQYWDIDSEKRELLKEISSVEYDPSLLGKIFFLCSNSNIYYQKNMMELLLKDKVESYFKNMICKALGNENRVDLIEYYCKKFEYFNDLQISKILDVISKTQDGEYYNYVFPLLSSKNKMIVDKAFETLVMIQAEEFLDQIEVYVNKYVKENDFIKLSVLRYLEDELTVKILDKLVNDKKLSKDLRAFAMKVMNEDIDKLFFTNLDTNNYSNILNDTKEDIELRVYALNLYSKIISSTPIEQLNKQKKQIKKVEKQILNYINETNFKLQEAAIVALKSNKLQAINLLELFLYLEDILFDIDKNIDMRNGLLEILCEQSRFYNDTSLIKNILQKGIKKFDDEMLINAIFFIGQYGYQEFLEEVRNYVRNSKNTNIRFIAIQALGDLKDYESTRLLYHLILDKNESDHIKSLSVEALVKLEPKLLLKHKDLTINNEYKVYRELCRYILEHNIILRRDHFLEEQYGK